MHALLWVALMRLAPAESGTNSIGCSREVALSIVQVNYMANYTVVPGGDKMYRSDSCSYEGGGGGRDRLFKGRQLVFKGSDCSKKYYSPWSL